MKKIVESVVELFAFIGWDYSRNPRHHLDHFKERSDVIVELEPNGWTKEAHGRLAVVPATKEFAVQWTDYLRQWYTATDLSLKTIAEKDRPLVVCTLQAFDTIYGTKNGQGTLPEPKVRSIYAYRRSLSTIDALAMRLLAGKGVVGFNMEINCDLYDGSLTKVEELEIAIAENTKKMAGAKRMVDADVFNGAKMLFDENLPEARLRESFPTGTAQKVFGICRADARYPEVKLVDRIKTAFDLKASDVEVLDYVVGGAVLYGPLPKDRFRQLLDGKDSKGLIPSANSVEQIVKESMTGSSKSPPMKNRDEIKALTNSADPIADMIIGDVLGKERNTFASYLKLPGAISCHRLLHPLVVEGHGEEVAAALQEIFTWHHPLPKADVVVEEPKLIAEEAVVGEQKLIEHQPVVEETKPAKKSGRKQHA